MPILAQVVLATPSGTAIKLLAAPDATDQNALGGFHSCNSKIVLHTDPELMPIERKDWVSWNVIESEQLTDRSVLTYWVPQLQVGRTHTSIVFGKVLTQ